MAASRARPSNWNVLAERKNAMLRLRLLSLLPAALLLAACAGENQLTLKATDIAYDRTRLEVTAGKPVTLTFINEGVLEHDFNILAFDVTDVHDSGAGGHGGHAGAQGDLHVSAKPGSMAMLEFTPTTPGVYEFYCTVPGHREAGMVGQLIVK